MKKSKEYYCTLRGLIILHNCKNKGKEADKVREEIDKLWSKMSNEERKTIEQLSLDLYEVERL